MIYCFDGIYYRKCKFVKSAELPEKRKRKMLIRSKTMASVGEGNNEKFISDDDIIFGDVIDDWDKMDLFDDDTKLDSDLFCIEYKKDIFKLYKKYEENIFGINKHYNSNGNKWIQKDITVKMRVILVDWLIDVHRKFRLIKPTLFLCIELLDRLLQKTQIPRYIQYI